jgi:membrane protease YdiL (CAAX protease family)
MEVEGGQREPNAFERWIEPAVPPARAWRFALGVIVGLIAWLAVGYATPWIYYYGWIILGDETTWDFWQEMSALEIGSTHLAVVVLLVSSAGFWVAAWLATKLHRQPFWSLVSPARRIRWRWFGIGVSLSMMELSMGWALSLALPSDALPARFNQPDMAMWAVFVLPIVALTFVQASGEELFFRGYLAQRLAARFRGPLVWGLLPSLVFGCLHYFGGVTLEHSIYYMVSTTIFGVTASVTVWRTGDLSAAIGYHFATNVTAFLLIGSDVMFVGTPIWLVSVHDVIDGMPTVIVIQVLILLFVLSPWGPKARPAKERVLADAVLQES